jgi:hypothetical protein
MSAHFADDAVISAVAAGLMDHSLPKLQWTHAAHFAATLWLLRHRGDLDLPAEMPRIIQTYNVAAGGENTDTAGYHETITQASLIAARTFLERYPTATPLHEIVDSLMASPLGCRDWLLAHWSRDLLFSPQARAVWIAPDLKPLAFS